MFNIFEKPSYSYTQGGAWDIARTKTHEKDGCIVLEEDLRLGHPSTRVPISRIKESIYVQIAKI